MDLEQLRSRCERAFGNTAPNLLLNRTRAIVGSATAMPATEEGKLAVEAYRKLQSGDEPTPTELSALQLLIRYTRPAPLVHGGRPDDLVKQEHADVFPNWHTFQDASDPVRLVCRIDQASPSLATAERIGTGLLVAPDLVMTNKHVLDVLSRGADVLQEGQAVVRFGIEDHSFAADAPVPIVGVAAVHKDLDLTLLRLKPTGQPAGLAISINSDTLAANTDVVVVGYPLDDPERNPLFIRNIFGAQFGVLRAAPGQCTSTFADGFYHDCSTLGGNSGSPVFSLNGAKLVGIHTGGGFLWKNAAVAGAAIAAFVDRATH
jgi:V8-like Glu-specific endopeptidase